jgi:hypothetical protein
MVNRVEPCQPIIYNYTTPLTLTGSVVPSGRNSCGAFIFPAMNRVTDCLTSLLTTPNRRDRKNSFDILRPPRLGIMT